MTSDIGQVESKDLILFRSRRRDDVSSARPTPADDMQNTAPMLLVNALPARNHVTVVARIAGILQGAARRENSAAFFHETADRLWQVAVNGPTGAPSSELMVLDVDGQRLTPAFTSDEQARNLLGSGVETLELRNADLLGLLRDRGVGVILDAGNKQDARLLAADDVGPVCDRIENTPAPDQPQDTVNSGGYKALMTPRHFPDSLQNTLNECLSPHSDRFGRAFLLRAEYDDGSSGYVIAFSNLVQRDRAEISAAVSAAIVQSGRTDVELDVAVLAQNEGTQERINRIALPLGTFGRKA